MGKLSNFFRMSYMRIYFDIGVLIYAFIISLVASITAVEDKLVLFLSNPTLTFILFVVFGIYGKQKFSPPQKKLTIFTISLSLLLVFNLYLNYKFTIMFIAISFPLIALARLLSNINFKKKIIRRINKNQISKALIIGGAGYIGYHTVKELLNNGFYVRVLDKLLFNPNSLNEFEKNKNFELIKGDCTNLISLTSAMKDIDVVIHLAGLVGDPACAVDEEMTMQTNVISARMARDIALSEGVSRFVFASSCSVYGVNPNLVNEKSKTNPVSLYAKTKVQSEKELLGTVHEDFCVTILRFATVFGHSARPRFDLVGNLFSAQAYTNQKLTVTGGDQWRPFVHVNDLARAILAVISSPEHKVNNQIFNVGSKNLNRTIMQLAKEVKTAYERRFSTKLKIVSSEIANSDKRNYKVSFDKIEQVLNFKCMNNFQDGIDEILKNFENKYYGNYKDKKYSNVEITKKFLSNKKDFHEETYTAFNLLEKN